MKKCTTPGHTLNVSFSYSEFDMEKTDTHATKIKLTQLTYTSDIDVTQNACQTRLLVNFIYTR